MMGTSGRNFDTSWTDEPLNENTQMTLASMSRAACTAAFATTRATESPPSPAGVGGCTSSPEDSATSQMRAIVRTASTG
jgi:hypothetical protein